MLPSMHLLKSLRRVHVHLSIEEAGAPGEGWSAHEVATLATKKFEDGGWHVYEGPGFDIDVEYDGNVYVVEAWAY